MVGLVVTAACSNYFSMTSYRGDEEKTIEFIQGELKDHAPKKLKHPKHGLAVKFIPSSEYLKGDVNLETYMIEDYLRKMSYIMRDDIHIKLYEFTKDMDKKDYEKRKAVTTISYKKQGLAANVKYLSSNLEFPPVEVTSITDDFDLELAFSYDKTTDETIVDSYCNYVNTTEGGNHEIVAQRAICEFFSREAKKLDPNNKFEVTFDDCKKGLIFCVNCRHIDPAYEGQHKSRVSNADVLREGKKVLISSLHRYFGNNNALLRRIISYLRTIAKIRLEAHKIKGVSVKKQTSFLDDNDIKMWYPLANRNYSGYTEFIIAEGDSAAVAIDNARNSLYQAVFGVMGVVNNVYGLTALQVMTKPVFRNMVNLLGCDIGPKFDISKLRYDKIIIEADADADGSNITSLVLLFFVLFMPELILQGKVYKALPPLLRLDEKSCRKWYKGSLFLYSKEEYYDVIDAIIADNTEVAIEDLTSNTKSSTVTPLKKKELRKWLKKNAEYTSCLSRLESRTACDTSVIEFVCWAKLHTNSELDMKDMIEEHFPELSYDLGDRLVSGSYQGKSISLIVDEIFWWATKEFMKLLSKNESLFLYVKNRNDDEDRFDRMSISEFLYLMEKTYDVRILQRYKGLGENDAEVLFASTLNPKTRKLVRFTIDDMKKTLEVFHLLHAGNAEVRQLRRDILKECNISYMDLDN